MKITPVEQDMHAPFVTIVFTKNEAKILKELLRYNIEDYKKPSGGLLAIPEDSNDTFASPIYGQLSALGI